MITVWWIKWQQFTMVLIIDYCRNIYINQWKLNVGCAHMCSGTQNIRQIKKNENYYVTWKEVIKWYCSRSSWIPKKIICTWDSSIPNMEVKENSSQKRYDVNMSSIFICPISVFHRKKNGTNGSFICLVTFQQHPGSFIILREASIYYP
jgi:hypothetical protein